MKVKNIIRDWLVTHKCDGLCNSDLECGCRLDDFIPCGELSMDCEAARSGTPPDDAEFADADFWMYPITMEADRETS